MNTETLYAYFDRELAPEAAAEVERALASDAALATRLEEISRFDGALGRLPGHVPPLDFTQRVLRVVQVDGALDLLPGQEASAGFTDRVVRAAHRARSRGRLVRFAVPLAVAAAVLAAVWLAPFAPAPPPPAPVESVDYAWEADLETFPSLAFTDLEDEILRELDAT